MSHAVFKVFLKGEEYLLSVSAKYWETIDFYPTLEGEFQSDKDDLIKRTKKEIEWYKHNATEPDIDGLVTALRICDIDARVTGKEKL